MQVTRSSRIISGLALAGALLLAGIVGFAQQPTTPGQGRSGGDRQGRMGREGSGFEGGGLFESLNLTDAQKQQMQQISARYHETFKAARNKQGRGGERGERGGESSIFNGGTFDEAAVRAAAQARANAQVEM